MPDYAAEGKEDIIKHAFEEGKRDCTVPAVLGYTEPFSFGITYHTLIIIISAVAMVLCCLVSFAFSLAHLRHWTNPTEQRQIVRILICLPIFAFFNFFAVWFYETSHYLQPIPQLYEAFSIVALFYLFMSYISPKSSQREKFYDELERRTHFGGKPKHGRGSLRWFHIIWICVFQLLLGRVATTVASELIAAKTCPLSTERSHGQLAVSLAQSVETTVAVVAIIHYYRRMKTDLRRHRAFFKLVAFKVIVFIDLIQNSLFSGLASARVFTPTLHVSYLDFVTGTPAFMICCEMFIFSVIFIKAFTVTPYRIESKQSPESRHSLGRAIVQVFDPTDMILGVGFMFKALQPQSSSKNYVDVEEEQRYTVVARQDHESQPLARMPA